MQCYSVAAAQQLQRQRAAGPFYKSAFADTSAPEPVASVLRPALRVKLRLDGRPPAAVRQAPLLLAVLVGQIVVQGLRVQLGEGLGADCADGEGIFRLCVVIAVTAWEWGCEGSRRVTKGRSWVREGQRM